MLSWALVALGMALFHFMPAPSLMQQIAQGSQGMTSQNLMALGYLFIISVIPIIGLWRLSMHLGLPRLLSLLYLVFPVAVVGVYVVWPFLRRLRPNR